MSFTSNWHGSPWRGSISRPSATYFFAILVPGSHCTQKWMHPRTSPDKHALCGSLHFFLCPNQKSRSGFLSYECLNYDCPTKKSGINKKHETHSAKLALYAKQNSHFLSMTFAPPTFSLPLGHPFGNCPPSSPKHHPWTSLLTLQGS